MTTANLSDRAKRSSPVPTDPEEARALVARATRGDSAAWTEIVQRYGLILHSTARRYGLSPDEHDDAVQRIWQQAVEHLHTVRDGAALPGWLATSIRRECLAVIRARAREALAGDMAEHDAQTGQPEVDDVVISSYEVAALHRAVKELPHQQRAIIHALLETPVPSYAEISHRLNMPIGSIGPNRRRALTRLAVSLAPLRA